MERRAISWPLPVRGIDLSCVIKIPMADLEQLDKEQIAAILNGIAIMQIASESCREAPRGQARLGGDM